MGRAACGVLFFLVSFFALEVHARQIQVLVTIPPQAFLVRAISGNSVQVLSIVGKGGDPHSFEFRPSEVKAFCQVEAYFLCGLELERKVKEGILGLNRAIRIFDSARNIPLRSYTPYEGRGIDPHFWLSPRLFKMQATNIFSDLCLLDPNREREFAKNLSALSKKLDQLDSRLKSSLANLKGRKLFVYHPALGYFADAYGLIQVSFEAEGREVSPRHMVEFIKMAQREKASFILATQPKKAVSDIARALKVPVFFFDPLDERYVEALDGLAALLRKGLQGG
jgi:zinc transport system substrate-binding protein